ncbi:MAG TPA: molybdopterin-dependent oxidoreductase, partial [Planctomycetia bacterium]|nr:molybdopterin-dependent oxidoreductase [Planctomycetia bacterium]
MSRLPPGQSETRRFPITGESDSAPGLAPETWRLAVHGLVAAPFSLTYAELLALPQRELVMDVHCVTGWSRLGTSFTGVPLAELLARTAIDPAAKFVRFIAHSVRDHDTSLPLELGLANAWLVHAVDGRPLPPERGGPVRVAVEGRYFFKSLKWVRRIELLAADRLGYWERESAYHNEADPLLEQRYDVARRASPEETAAFRALADFAPYRDDPVLLMANFANWKPLSKDLRGVRLKACNFDGADLSGCDFRGANLTRSRFFRADLSGCDFTGADLEGADFSGARLTGAKFEDV